MSQIRSKTSYTFFTVQAHGVRMITLRLRAKPVASSSDHRANLDAIVRGDAAVARETHRQHRQRSCETLVHILTSHGLAQL